jgi:hypothetical protein
MLIRIPPYHERYAGRPEPKSIWEGIKLDPSEYDDDGYGYGAFSYSSYEESGDEYGERETEDEDGDNDEDDESEESGDQAGAEGGAADA